ncbi:MAG: DUF5320 domain-containing protein [Fidelibacterota bacterium]
MPRGDRRGPEGFGAMTGRGLGYCAGYDSPGFTKGTPRGGAGFGRGMGSGRGMGRGHGYAWRVNYPQPHYPAAPAYSREQELDMLKGQAEDMKTSLEAINKRIEDLEKE